MHTKSSVILFSIVRLITFSFLIGVSSQCYKQHWCNDSQTFKTMVFSIMGLVLNIIFFLCVMILEFEEEMVKKGIHAMMVFNNIIFYLILSIQNLSCPFLQTIFILYSITEIVLLSPQLKQIAINQENEKFHWIIIYLLLIDLRILLNNYYQKSVGNSKISTALFVCLVLLCCLKISIISLINEDYLDIFLHLAYGTNLICSIIPFFCSFKPSDVAFCGVLAFIFISIDWCFGHLVLQEQSLDRELEIYYIMNQITGFGGIMFYSIDNFQNNSLKYSGQLFCALTILISNIIPVINLEKKRQDEVAFFFSIVNVLFAITLGCLTINGTDYFVDNIIFSTIYGVYTLIFTLMISKKMSEGKSELFGYQINDNKSPQIQSTNNESKINSTNLQIIENKADNENRIISSSQQLFDKSQNIEIKTKQ